MAISASSKDQVQDLAVPAVPGHWSYKALATSQSRWYFLRTPLSLKAIYSQDILHRAHLQRFCTTDSNKLEEAFRERQDELEKVWWEEQAELGSRQAPGSAKGSAQLPEVEETSVGWQDYFHGEEGEIGLGVKGGLYEADLKQRRLKASYWPEASHRILRGTWFVEKSPDWVPLKGPLSGATYLPSTGIPSARTVPPEPNVIVSPFNSLSHLQEATADELEEAYRSEIWHPSRGRAGPQKGQPAHGARVDLQTLRNEAKGWFALFVSDQEIYLCKDDSFSWLSRKLTTSSSTPGMRLRRGYDPPPEGVSVQEADPKAEEADEAAAAQPVEKLLLVVHGIGQNLGGANIVADAAALRQNIRLLSADQLAEKDQSNRRIEVLPVQWRKHLNLDVDTMADALMPPGVRPLRQMLHATAVEVLLYLTQLHCQEMLDSLVASLNLQFQKFQKRNPSFEGEVSILAHSLGSVLCYDILCNQPHLHANLMTRLRKDSAEQDSALASFGSMQPMQSSDLDPSAMQQANDLTATDFGKTSEAMQPISPDLTDLSDLVGKSRPTSPFGSELESLRHENARLRAQLDAERRQSGWGTTTSFPTSLRQAKPGKSNLAPAVTVKPLAFHVTAFIAIGSPLGIFLTLRKVNPGRGRCLGSREAADLMPGEPASTGDGLPAAERMFNLYHPFDPVGFRLEPLISVGAEKRRPVYAAYCKGGRRLHVGLTEFGEDVSAAMSAGAAKASSLFQNSLSSLKLSSITSSLKRPTAPKEPPAEETKLTKEEEEEEVGVLRASQAAESAIWRLTDGQGDPADRATLSRSAQGRLDFVLQSGNVENPWLSAMSSHFAYWASPDVALFILRALHHYDVRLGPLKDSSLPNPPAKTPPENVTAETLVSPKGLATPKEILSPATPSSPLSPIHRSDPESGLLRASVGSHGSREMLSMGPKEVLPRGLADPEDWW